MTTDVHYRDFFEPVNTFFEVFSVSPLFIEQKSAFKRHINQLYLRIKKFNFFLLFKTFKSTEPEILYHVQPVLKMGQYSSVIGMISTA